MATLNSVDAVTSGSALTAPAGSNRVLIIAVPHESGDARYLTSVTWNGVSVGQVGPSAVETSSTSNTRAINTWIVLESEIAAYSGTAWSRTFNVTASNNQSHQFWLQDAAQSYTLSGVDDTVGGTGTTATRTVTVPSSGIGLAVVCTNWDTGADFTWINATEQWDASQSTNQRNSGASNSTAGAQGMQASWTDSVGYAMLGLAISDVSGSASIAPLANYYRMLRNA